MCDKSYEIVQTNLQRKELALQEILLEATKRKFAIALLQEPYVGNIGRLKEYKGTKIYQCAIPEAGTVKAAIIVFDDTIDVIQYPEYTTTNIAVVKLRTDAWELLVVSFYFEPDQDIELYLEHLEKINTRIKCKMKIIGGDSNAKNTWWGSQKIDHRGEKMADVIFDMGWHVLNVGDTPTFETVRGHKHYSSHVDITVCTPETIAFIEKWLVETDITSSDHNTITFQIRLTKSKGININRTTRIYNTRKANWLKFCENISQYCIENKINKTEFEQITDTQQLENKINTYITIINKVCNKYIPKKKNINKINITWWTEQLTKLKREALTKKRRIRCANQTRRALVIEEYLQAKEKYEQEMNIARIESWKKFCNKQEKEGIWDSIYRVIGRITERSQELPLIINGNTLTELESAEYLANTFYPKDKPEDDNTDHQRLRTLANNLNRNNEEGPQDPPFTTLELETALKDFNTKKAPGNDGLTVDICAKVITLDPSIFLSLANKCLELGYFPKIWKEATVVLLKKPGKTDYTKPKAYRPIGLLPVMGKILEKILINRIKWHIIPSLNPKQYGFMPQKSTEDSLYDMMNYIRTKLNEKKLIVLVSLDIEGAFDSAWWPAIKIQLATTKCPINLQKVIDSYLNNRKITLKYAGTQITKDTNKGCVQGSIGGPILWNLLLNPLLNILDTCKVYSQAFADDIVLIFDGQTNTEIQINADATLTRVWEWGVQNKLKFAPQKTNAMVLTQKLKYDTPNLSNPNINIRD